MMIASNYVALRQSNLTQSPEWQWVECKDHRQVALWHNGVQVGNVWYRLDWMKGTVGDYYPLKGERWSENPEALPEGAPEPPPHVCK